MAYGGGVITVVAEAAIFRMTPVFSSSYNKQHSKLYHFHPKRNGDCTASAEAHT